jgi:alanine racemase
VHSISTHLPVADEDAKYTLAQLHRFAGLADHLRSIAPEAKMHALNSAGILGFPEPRTRPGPPGLDALWQRLSIGIPAALASGVDLEARVLLVREVGENQSVSYGRTFITPQRMRIATLAIGYADGFHARHPDSPVLVGGRRCAVLGRVTMDQILVDVTALSRVAAGDEAIVIGKQGSGGDFGQRIGRSSWHNIQGHFHGHRKPHAPLLFLRLSADG